MIIINCFFKDYIQIIFFKTILISLFLFFIFNVFLYFIALDPAQPGFQAKDPAVRIDKKDAKLVDIIHTDGKAFVPFLGLGMTVSVGHIDFFVNGGFAQPNCFLDDKPFIKSIADIPKITLDGKIYVHIYIYIIVYFIIIYFIIDRPIFSPL